MHYPDDATLRGLFISSLHAGFLYNSLKSGLLDESAVFKDFYEAHKEATEFLEKNFADISKRKQLGETAGTIAALLLAQKIYYEKKPAPPYFTASPTYDKPSLKKAFDLMKGWAQEYREKTGKKIPSNRNFLNSAWQRFGCVAHLWMAENLLSATTNETPTFEQLLTSGMLSQALERFLIGAKGHLSALAVMDPHPFYAKGDPVFDVSEAYWVPDNIDRGIPVVMPVNKPMDDFLQAMKADMKRFKNLSRQGKNQPPAA